MYAVPHLFCGLSKATHAAAFLAVLLVVVTSKGKEGEQAWRDIVLRVET